MPESSFTPLPSPQDSPFALLTGGFARCDPAWNRASDGTDRCYKLYIPVAGEARLTLDSQAATVRAGAAYLIPGYHLTRHECPVRMDVYWLHFTPQSLDLAYLLSQLATVETLGRPAMRYWRATFLALASFFETFDAQQQRPGPLYYRIQAMLMDFVSATLEKRRFAPGAAMAPAFERLRPAIVFMDQHFWRNPRLADVAKAAHLAPNYFHRKFKSLFGITPFGYMLDRRLNLGRQLLRSTDLPLAKIAERSGFSDEFHFSKTFKKRCRLSPKEFRRRASP
jgi:AraC family transcriptional regulator, arabinose operon regulatory protein